jgi:hypothetical protein
MSQPQPSFSTKQRWIIALNVALSIVAVFALTIIANYLATRYFTRLQWRSDNPNQLSAQTLNLLRSLTNEVKVVVFFQRESIEFHSAVSALLAEYQLACPDNLKVEYVDYVRDPAAAGFIKEKYKLQLPGDDYAKDMVVFDCNGRPKLVYEKDLYDLDYQSLMAGKSKEVRRTGFKGELKFTEAINSVIDTQQLKAYFLLGHGEHAMDDKGGTMSYSKFATAIRLQNIDFDLDNGLLLTKGEVPEDCNLLVVAGPVQTLESVELERIQKYLTKGGRMLVLVNPRNFMDQRWTGLEKLLGGWGLQLGKNMILGYTGGLNKEELTAKSFETTNFLAFSHPIVRPLLRSQLEFYMPCTVEKKTGGRQDADAPRVDELVATETNTIASQAIRDNQPVVSFFQDRHGPLAVAASVEKGSVLGIGADRRSTRIVVIGDSMVLSNGMWDILANRDFGLQCVNWLVDNPRLMGGIVARPVKEYRVIMSQSQLTSVAWILMAGFPGAVLCLGFLVWFRRRS